MASDDQEPSSTEKDAADTASFQRFMDEHDHPRTDDNRTFRLVTLLIGLVVLAGVIYLLLQ